MTDRAATQVMRRKAGSGRPAPARTRMTVGHAWKVAVPRAADATLGIRATAIEVGEERSTRGRVPALIPPNALITLLEGPENRFGVAMLDPAMLSAVVEASTTGRLAHRPVAERAPTRTDAMMSADLIDALCEEFELALTEMDAPPNLAGYRYAAPLLDAAAMSMVLPEAPYCVFRLALDLGGGLRRGEILVVLPHAPAVASRGEETAEFQARLSGNVMEARADLDAVLWRVRMTLADATRLQAGDILRVPLDALGAVQVGTGGAANLAVARLGQQGGRRAVRIADTGGRGIDDVDPREFVEAAPAAPPAALPPAKARRAGATERDAHD